MEPLDRREWSRECWPRDPRGLGRSACGLVPSTVAGVHPHPLDKQKHIRRLRRDDEKQRKEEIPSGHTCDPCLDKDLAPAADDDDDAAAASRLVCSISFRALSFKSSVVFGSRAEGLIDEAFVSSAVGLVSDRSDGTWLSR